MASFFGSRTVEVMYPRRANYWAPSKIVKPRPRMDEKLWGIIFSLSSSWTSPRLTIPVFGPTTGPILSQFKGLEIRWSTTFIISENIERQILRLFFSWKGRSGSKAAKRLKLQLSQYGYLYTIILVVYASK